MSACYFPDPDEEEQPPDAKENTDSMKLNRQGDKCRCHITKYVILSRINFGCKIFFLCEHILCEILFSQ